MGRTQTGRTQKRLRVGCGVRRLSVGAAVSIVLALGLSGCAETYGVDVVNSSDRTLNAEMLTIDPSGEMTTYGRAVVNPGGSFKNRMDSSVRGQSMRVRFTIEGETEQDENWVLLHLPRDQTRFYELRVTDGRLHADPQKRGRPETIKSKE